MGLGFGDGLLLYDITLRMKPSWWKCLDLTLWCTLEWIPLNIPN